MAAFVVLGALFWLTGFGYTLWSLHDQRKLLRDLSEFAEKVHQDRLDIAELLKSAGVEVLQVKSEDL